MKSLFAIDGSASSILMLKDFYKLGDKVVCHGCSSFNVTRKNIQSIGKLLNINIIFKEFVEPSIEGVDAVPLHNAYYQMSFASVDAFSNNFYDKVFFPFHKSSTEPRTDIVGLIRDGETIFEGLCKGVNLVYPYKDITIEKIEEQIETHFKEFITPLNTWNTNAIF